MAYIEMKHCYKRYHVGDTEIVANRDVNFEIEKGELVIILGASVQASQRFLTFLEEWIPIMRGKAGLMVSILQAIVLTRELITAEMMSVLFFSFII